MIAEQIEAELDVFVIVQAGPAGPMHVSRRKPILESAGAQLRKNCPGSRPAGLSPRPIKPQRMGLQVLHPHQSPQHRRMPHGALTDINQVRD